MKHKKGNLLILMGVGLICCALALTGFNFRESRRAGDASARILRSMDALVPEPVEQDYLPQELPEGTRPGKSEEYYPNYILNPEMDMPEQDIDGIRCVGRVEIESIGLDLPVAGDWSERLLNAAPCRYSGSVYLNNMVVMAHNYESHFRDLRDVRTGDVVTFTDMDGNLFRYRVVAVETLMAAAVEEMTSGEWDLTLFTCTVGGSYRHTIRCDLIREV